MVSLKQLFEWFTTGKFPSEAQFQEQFKSFWHKSERIDQSAVLGLPDALADKVDRDELLNLGVGIKGYGDDVQTVADLENVPNKYEGLAVAVLSEVDENGRTYIYLYNGQSWDKTPFTTLPTNVATKADLTEKVDKNKDDIINKLTEISWTNGAYLQNNSEVDNTNWSYSDFVGIDVYIKYCFLALTSPVYLGCVYDADKNYIGNITHVNGVITLPANAAFLRINTKTDEISNSFLVSAFDYQRLIGNQVLKSIQIQSLDIVFDEVKGINKNNNLFKDLNLKFGFYLGSNNDLIANASYSYSENYIEVEPGQIYYSNLQIDYLLYDADKNFIQRVVNLDEQSFITTDNTKYVRVNVSKSNDLSQIYLYSQSDAPYYLNIPANGIESSKPFIAKNYLDKSNAQPGYYTNAGQLVKNPTFKNISFAIEPDTEYVFNKLIGDVNGIFIDRSGLIYSIGGDGSALYSIKSPKDVVKVILNCSNNDLNIKFWKQKDAYNIEVLGAYKPSKITTITEPDPVNYQFDLSMRNDNTYVGAMNTIIDAFHAANPRIRIAMATHFTKDGRREGQNGYLKNVVDTQLKLAEYWGIPCLDLSKKCGWIKKNNTNTIKPFFDDCLHPGNDLTGQSSTLLKNFFVEFLRPIFGNDWNGKKVAVCGTSITVGWGGAGGNPNAKHIDAAIKELGGIPENVAVAGQTARLKKVDGTLITLTNSSFMDAGNSKNYLYVAGKIANNEFDLVILDHGVNDHALDQTDFVTPY